MDPVFEGMNEQPLGGAMGRGLARRRDIAALPNGRKVERAGERAGWVPLLTAWRSRGTPGKVARAGDLHLSSGG